MKTTKWLGIAAAAGIASGGLFMVKAHGAERALAQRQFGGGQLFERAKEKLGLTDDQVSKIKTELKGEKDTLKSLLTRLHEAKTGLRDAIQASDANDTSVRAASAKVAALEADLAVERLKLYGRISPILTSEQRDKIMEFHAKVDDFVDGVINRIGERLTAD